MTIGLPRPIVFQHSKCFSALPRPSAFQHSKCFSALQVFFSTPSIHSVFFSPSNKSVYTYKVLVFLKWLDTTREKTSQSTLENNFSSDKCRRVTPLKTNFHPWKIIAVRFTKHPTNDYWITKTMCFLPLQVLLSTPSAFQHYPDQVLFSTPSVL